MASFAKLNDQNEVLTVLTVSDNDCLDSDNNFSEEVGRQFLENSTGWTKCKQTSYNSRHGIYYTPNTTEQDPDQTKLFRGTHASVGMIYDETNDIFKIKQPYPSWTWNASSYEWEAPTSKPDNPEPDYYMWDEGSQSWVLHSPEPTA